jgi:predicted AAA+ superfamily ATPase
VSRAHPKVYGTDPGLVCAFSLPADPLADGKVVGRLVETAALRHLEEAAELWDGRLSFYRENGMEADFVLETRAGALVVEVMAGREPHREKARMAAAVARQIRGAVPVCASRVPMRSQHDLPEGGVPEVPLWEFFVNLIRTATMQEFLSWLRAT